MKKVITYGTFDLFHLGHYNILKRAKECGDYLIVGVTSENFDIERGKLSVHDSLTTRIENVMKTGFADQIVVEEYVGQKTQDIIKYDVDVFVVGDDWRGKFDHLKKYCDIVYLDRTKNISSSQIRESSDNILKIGVVTDDIDDHSVTNEAKYVSGLHVENVFVEDEKLGEEFCRKYQIDRYHTDFNEFTSGIDIVIITTQLDKREKFVKAALQAGKHVICAAPVTLDKQIMTELFALAQANQVALIENIATVYLKAFAQLIWMVQGGVLGEIHNMHCRMTASHLPHNTSYFDMKYLGVCMLVKLLGENFDQVFPLIKTDENGHIQYANLSFTNGTSLGTVEIGIDTQLQDELIITGRHANIVIRDDWWNTDFFELRTYADQYVKRYSYNFEGSGFRYVLQELLIMMRNRRFENSRLFSNESLAIVELLNQGEDTYD